MVHIGEHISFTSSVWFSGSRISATPTAAQQRHYPQHQQLLQQQQWQWQRRRRRRLRVASVNSLGLLITHTHGRHAGVATDSAAPVRIESSLISDRAAAVCALSSAVGAAGINCQR